MVASNHSRVIGGTVGVANVKVGKVLGRVELAVVETIVATFSASRTTGSIG